MWRNIILAGLPLRERIRQFLWWVVNPQQVRYKRHVDLLLWRLDNGEEVTEHEKESAVKYIKRLDNRIATGVLSRMQDYHPEFFDEYMDELLDAYASSTKASA